MIAILRLAGKAEPIVSFYSFVVLLQIGTMVLTAYESSFMCGYNKLKSKNVCNDIPEQTSQSK